MNGATLGAAVDGSCLNGSIELGKTKLGSVPVVQWDAAMNWGRAGDVDKLQWPAGENDDGQHCPLTRASILSIAIIQSFLPSTVDLHLGPRYVSCGNETAKAGPWTQAGMSAEATVEIVTFSRFFGIRDPSHLETKFG